MRVCAEFFAADGTRCGKLNGPWTEPFHLDSHNNPLLHTTVGTNITDEDSITKGS